MIHLKNLIDVNLTTSPQKALPLVKEKDKTKQKEQKKDNIDKKT